MIKPLSIIGTATVDAIPSAVSVCLSFTVVATATKLAGFDVNQGVAFTATTFAAPAQLLAAQMLRAGADIFPVIAAVGLVNIRFSIMSFALARYLSGAHAVLLIPALLSMSASSFALCTLRYRADNPAPNDAALYLLGSCICILFGGLVGVAFGTIIVEKLGNEVDAIVGTAVALLIGTRLIGRSDRDLSKLLFIAAAFFVESAARVVSPMYGPLVALFLLPLAMVIRPRKLGACHE